MDAARRLKLACNRWFAPRRPSNSLSALESSALCSSTLRSRWAQRAASEAAISELVASSAAGAASEPLAFAAPVALRERSLWVSAAWRAVSLAAKYSVCPEPHDLRSSPCRDPRHAFPVERSLRSRAAVARPQAQLRATPVEWGKCLPPSSRDPTQWSAAPTGWR